MKREAGFTLIETLIGLVVMMLMVTAVITLFINNLSVLTYSKARTIGLGLADEQMETLRDLPYDSVATQHGSIYPGGNVADDQTLVRGGYTFTVHTKIVYVDDPYDGIESGPAGGKPQDLYPYDYKRAQITVALKSNNRQVASLSTDLAGKAAETSSSTGIISATVVDANGNPVQGATVHILNTIPNPDVDITTTTDNNGLVVVPKLPLDSSNHYQVTASLPGDSTDGTTADPAGSQIATKPNLNVLAQQITSVTLAIDQTATMAISAVTPSGQPVTGLALTITGTKTKYQNPSVAKNTYTGTTDTSGNLTLTGMEWDSYNFAAPAGSYIVSTQPYAPTALAPGNSLAVKLIVSSSSTYPDIDTVTPTTASVSGGSVVVTVTGRNLTTGTTLSLTKSGSSNLTATGVTATGTKLTGTFNLSGAATGGWDLIVSGSGGSLTQAGGFNVTP